jgi:hypothetical protein
MNSSRAVAYSEVHGLLAALPYASEAAGPCIIIQHPKWHTNVYPSSMFVNAPPDIVKDVLTKFSLDNAIENDNNDDDKVK